MYSSVVERVLALYEKVTSNLIEIVYSSSVGSSLAVVRSAAEGTPLCRQYDRFTFCNNDRVLEVGGQCPVDRSYSPAITHHDGESRTNRDNRLHSYNEALG